MNLTEELKKPRTRIHAQAVADWIVQDPSSLDALMKIYFEPNIRVTQNAAYFLMYVSDKKPELLKPYVVPIIENLSMNPSIAVKRNSVRILQQLDIPEDYQGQLFEICFGFMTSSQEPIAVKAFSMTVLVNLAKIYPELSTEIIPYLQEYEKMGSAGLKSRARKLLIELKKLN